MTTLTYKGRRPASKKASAAARGASKKSDTRCELALRRALWRAGCRYRTNVVELPGKPDIVFTKARLAVFCDGDFWHGKDWDERSKKLRRGTNSDYWLEKIRRNRTRDWRNTRALLDGGFTVLRFWESEILADPEGTARKVLQVLDARGHRQTRRRGLTRAEQDGRVGETKA